MATLHHPAARLVAAAFALILSAGLQGPTRGQAAEAGPEADGDPPPREIIERNIRTGIREQPEIRLLIRLPESTADTEPRGLLDAVQPPADGVLIYCTFESNVERLRANLQNDRSTINRYADERNLAVITFNTATLWRSRRSHESLTLQERLNHDRIVDRVAGAWDRGIRGLCREQNLPHENFLIYGVSRGAHYAHRLVLRYPQRFLAAHIHVANSYDQPTRGARDVLWLVTTGDVDSGSDQAMAFYRDCQQEGYPILYQSFLGLGHRADGRVEQLRAAFFDQALALQRQTEHGFGGDYQSPAEWMRHYLEHPPFIADPVNGLVFPATMADRIDPAVRVPLPTVDLAHQWGRLVRSR